MPIEAKGLSDFKPSKLLRGQFLFECSKAALRPCKTSKGEDQVLLVIDNDVISGPEEYDEELALGKTYSEFVRVDFENITNEWWRKRCMDKLYSIIAAYGIPAEGLNCDENDFVGEQAKVAIKVENDQDGVPREVVKHWFIKGQ